MRLPTRLPDSNEDRNILGEFYNLHSRAQWFDMALIDENHPTQFKKSLVIYANYTPTLEMKEILSFTHKYALGLEIKDKAHRD
jgi:hypothetical protein